MIGGWSESIGAGFAKSLDASGRATRAEFWRFWLFHFGVPVLVGFGAAPLLARVSPMAAEVVLGVAIAIYLVTVPGVFCGIIRRQHDIGKPGTLAGGAYIFVLVAAALTLAYLLSQVMPEPFERINAWLEHTQATDGSAVMLAVAPGAIFFGVMEIILFAMVMTMIVIAVGPPLFLLLIAIGTGLARPSDPGDNQYGPVLSEVHP